MTSQDVSDAPTVAPRVLADRVARGDDVAIVDLRNRDEVDEWRIDGPNVTVEQVPYSRFVQAQVTGDVADLVADVPEPLVVVCAAGEASAEVANALAEAGVDAVHLEAGMEGWARLITSVETETSAGTIVQYDRPSSGCLSYLLVSGDEAVVVDPLRAFTDRYARDASDRNADIAYAIDTHVHADHVSGVRDVARGTDAQPVLPEGARERGLTYGARPLAAGETLAFGDAAVRAVGLPGHTSEMTGLEFGDAVLVGDSVFVDGVARPDLEAQFDDDPEARALDLAERLHRTITEQLCSLPPTTRLFPGHRSPDAPRADDGTFSTTVADVHDTLDAVGRDRAAFVDAVLSESPPPKNYRRIVDVNLGRESIDDETAFELELGPNNCAVN
ncbi:MBL fold metallo-hydrolase [Halorubellus sp. JP-L1]|uniref:MBL fold metallo-hydrolase n=1 Tax=Halorubellus sp. JP-L1 TaxID=2715753 RepID=UPI00140793F0|nr:MBL fold metallo-hydrolase [Halorubellus sp. JP-L1]NHN42463.1 MBL fold metallo-hydrolase [Halorubellus sp. JP-L1]